MSEQGGEQVGQSGNFQTQCAPCPTGPSRCWAVSGPQRGACVCPPMVIHTLPIHLSAQPHPPMPRLHLHASQLPASRTQCAGSWLQLRRTSLSCHVCFPVMNMLARIQEGSGEWGGRRAVGDQGMGVKVSLKSKLRKHYHPLVPSQNPMTKSRGIISQIPNPWPRERLLRRSGYGT